MLIFDIFSFLWLGMKIFTDLIFEYSGETQSKKLTWWLNHNFNLNYEIDIDWPWDLIQYNTCNDDIHDIISIAFPLWIIL